MPVDLGKFFQVPRNFFGSGVGAKLGPSTALVYVALCEAANRDWPKGSNTFTVSDRTLAADTGLSPRTIHDSRKRLMEARLVTCERKEGCSFTYTLQAQTLTAVPRKLRPRQEKQPRASQSPHHLPSALFGTHAKYATPYSRVC
jgi:hypothetical protein